MSVDEHFAVGGGVFFPPVCAPRGLRRVSSNPAWWGPCLAVPPQRPLSALPRMETAVLLVPETPHRAGTATPAEVPLGQTGLADGHIPHGHMKDCHRGTVSS